MSEEVFKFQRLYADEPNAAALHEAAVEKLQTLYPGKRITTYDLLTIAIETDSLYAETGVDTYELGMIDGETPAIRNTRNDEVLTFRI